MIKTCLRDLWVSTENLGAITLVNLKLCNERWMGKKDIWPNITVVYWPPTQPNMPFQRRRKLHIPSAWASLADNMGQGQNPMVQSQTDALEESDLRTAWQLFPLDDDQTCHSKDGRSAYSDGQLWEEIEVGVELLYNSVHRKFNEFGDQKSWRNDAVEKTAPSRELGPRASGWATLENEKDTLLYLEELGRSICCSSVRSPTPSHTQPFQ